ncbi:MAG: DUF4136 domain-containing protein, partial [Thermoanaerobaculia bacterium]
MTIHRLYTLLVVLAAITAAPALAQKVYVDYDRATAFSQYRTFQFKETREDLRNFSETLHQRVVDTLRAGMEEGGLKEVASDPDIYVAYYTADQGNLRLVLSDLEYTYGRDFSLGSYWEGGVGTRNLENFSFNEGTLIIDAWDAKEKKLVWRGIGTAAMAKKKPDKNEKKLDRALEKIMQRW